MTHRPIAPALIIMLAITAAFLVTTDQIVVRGVALALAYVAGIIWGVKSPLGKSATDAQPGGDSA